MLFDSIVYPTPLLGARAAFMWVDSLTKPKCNSHYLGYIRTALPLPHMFEFWLLFYVQSFLKSSTWRSRVGLFWASYGRLGWCRGRWYFFMTWAQGKLNNHVEYVSGMQKKAIYIRRLTDTASSIDYCDSRIEAKLVWSCIRPWASSHSRWPSSKTFSQ